MGLRLRLKSSFDCGSEAGEAQIICVALKTYGMIVAEIGTDWALGGVSDPRLYGAVLELGAIGSDFEVVDTEAKLCTVLDCTN